MYKLYETHNIYKLYEAHNKLYKTHMYFFLFMYLTSMGCQLRTVKICILQKSSQCPWGPPPPPKMAKNVNFHTFSITFYMHI